MQAFETVRCHGHRNIRGTHPSTFEITRDEDLTLQGDCIIGVGADKGAADLDPAFSRLLRNDRAILLTTLRTRTCEVRVSSRGAGGLILSHPHELVWRRSRYIDGRTVGICSDLAAIHLPRSLIHQLRDKEDMTIEMAVITPD